MQPPIIIIDRSREVSVFSSVATAAAELESPDIGEYQAFDSHGRTVNLHTDAGRTSGRIVDILPVRLTGGRITPESVAALEGALLEALGPGHASTNTGLETLVATAEKRFLVR